MPTPRLLAAAKEFNIGKETLLEFLNGNGFEVKNNPNTKLTEEMYAALQNEFAQDKAAKKKSEQIALPKGVGEKPTVKDEPVLQKKIIDLALDQHESEVPEKEVEKEEPAKEESPIVEEAPVKQVEADAPAAEVPDTPEAAAPQAAEGVTEETKPAQEEQGEKPLEEKPDIPDTTGTGADNAQDKVAETPSSSTRKLDGPKFLGKIDLDEINQSVRPKKSVKKKDAETKAPKSGAAKETKKPVDKPVKKEDTTLKEDIKKEEVKAAPTVPSPILPKLEEIKPEHIEMNSPRLSGPKILGKIELPVSGTGDKRDGERRKRKRIPVDKKTETAKPGEATAREGTSPSGRTERGPAGARGRNDRNPNTERRSDRRRNERNALQPTQEIDEKQIQKKIQETQAKLAGNTRGKTNKSKYRRDKRDMMAEKRSAAENAEQHNTIQLTEFISVSDLANLLDVSFTEVISKCMSLGIMVSINQRLDAEVIELVAAEFDYEVEFINLQQEAEDDGEEVDAEEDLIYRPPIVTIMGHVDHGKTSLLDHIREANVVAGEAGGITQHIGAYQVSIGEGKKITFLDTPGHEAFTAMRARGAKVADVAVIVIAADDAIMPQTKEAISHAQAANLPMIFAINKIDKEGANPEKIKEQLSALNILVEDWGGKFQSQEISAKLNLNIDLLLEKIILESELLDLKANPDREGSGSIIEASLDKGRGYVATILVQNGKLRLGDMVVCGQHYGKIKAMFNERGQRVKEAGPSVAVQVLGLNGAPQAGEKFKVYDDENIAKDVANKRSQIMREQGIRARKHLTLDEIGRRLALGNFKELPIIIKGDFDGSVEALSDSLQKLSTEEVAVNVVHKGVGQITESDVNLATASDAIILGFQVRPSAQAARLAEQENIEIRTYSIIYDAIEEVKSAMEGLLEPKMEKRTVANVEVREVYKISGVGTIAGCYVLDGKLGRNTRVNVIRDGIVVHSGEIASLKRFKDDMKEVSAGYECGISLKNFNDLKVGDIFEGYEEVEVKRTL